MNNLNTLEKNGTPSMNLKSVITVLALLGMICAPAFAEQQAQNQTQNSGAAANGLAQSGVTATSPVAQSGVQATLPSVEPLAPGEVRVPYIPQAVKDEITETIRQEVLAQARGERWGDPGSLPSWLNRISLAGDFRLRGESDGFPSGNATPAQYNPAGLTLISDTTERNNYMRIQARLDMKAKVSDSTYTDFRISSGTTTNPDSTNQTLGTGFNKSSLVLDRAFVHSDVYPWLAFNGGKIPNPWLSTDLVWDADVNFEGAAGQAKSQLNDAWAGFITVGAFPYQYIQKSDTVYANPKWLYGSQLGMAWAAPDTSNVQFGVALYDFMHVEGITNPTQGTHFYDQTAAQGMQKGNTLMYVNAVGDPVLYGIASKFRELDVTAKMDLASLDPFHVLLAGDFVRNLGYNQQDILQRTGLAAPPPQINAYQVTLTVGMPKILRAGDWQANVAYKYLESDAVLDALTDSDFHLGGTNAKGFIVGGSYGLDDNVWTTVRWISTDQISGAPLAIDTLQIDLNTRF